ncbi:phosphoethanolamine transferase [Undibacterium sp. Ji67W]|uniref:phosphoethanolamine transferase n=1 Tax=Undibacterium sp. Ji67W TaxID=3413042 RepID=UPI003BF15E57
MMTRFSLRSLRSLSSLRPGSYFLLGSYVLLSAVAFFSYAIGNSIDHTWQLFFTELVAWIIFWAVFQRPRWFHYLLLPAMLAVPVEIYLRLYFGQGISTHHLGIIFETSPKEAMEFLGQKVWLLLLLMIAICGWWGLTLKAARSSNELEWQHFSRWIVIALALAGTAIWQYGSCVGIAAAPVVAHSNPDSSDEEDSASSAPTTETKGRVLSNPDLERLRQRLVISPGKLPAWAAIPYSEEVMTQTWPFGLVSYAIDFWNERRYFQELSEKNRNFRFHAKLIGDPETPQTVLVVIGESSRFDRWSLNGYRRDTNPRLSSENNLVSLTDMVTPVTATRLSVPIIVSRKPATMGLRAGFSEKSFLTAYREAGFKTFWISNQMSFGKFDTPVSAFAKEADVTGFLNMGGFTNTSNFDEILLTPMTLAMHDPSPKKLIVLHTLGNHWNYSHRYPKQYDQWQPSLFGVVDPEYTDLKNKEALNNSYDNSILYTDWILGELIERLKASNQLSSMMYISDHGQTLYDGDCLLAFHGHNTQFEFHIPAFIWYSDAYQEQFPEKIAQLHKHQKSKLSTENVFHTLLDMGNIQYPDEKLDWSILNTQLQKHTRFVDSKGWVDYDNADMNGSCREVITKKPARKKKKVRK